MNTILADIVRRTRQHHAIEHATIHMLSARFPTQHFSGVSDPLGFTIYGDVGDGEVRRAVSDALLRLQVGERDLAIHPDCGTNLAVTGVLVTLAALLTSNGRQGFLQRFSTTLLLVLPMLIVARPLGMRLQTYTTLADVSDRWVQEIRTMLVGNVRAYRVLFE